MNKMMLKTALISTLISLSVPALAQEEVYPLTVDIHALNDTVGLDFYYYDTAAAKYVWEGYEEIVPNGSAVIYERETNNTYKIKVLKGSASWECTAKDSEEIKEILHDAKHVAVDVNYVANPVADSTCIILEPAVTSINTYINGLSTSETATLNIYDYVNQESGSPVTYNVKNSENALGDWLNPAYSVRNGSEKMRINLELPTANYYCIFKDTGSRDILAENYTKPLYIQFHKEQGSCLLAYEAFQLVVDTKINFTNGEDPSKIHFVYSQILDNGEIRDNGAEHLTLADLQQTPTLSVPLAYGDHSVVETEFWMFQDNGSGHYYNFEQCTFHNGNPVISPDVRYVDINMYSAENPYKHEVWACDLSE